MKSIDGSKLNIKEIAKEIDSPIHFTAKILQTLVHERIISSIKGPNGGFFIEANAKPTPLIDIVKAVDGERVFNTCSMGLKECSDKFPCPIHFEMKKYKETLTTVMKEKTIQDLITDLSLGKTFLKITR